MALSWSFAIANRLHVNLEEKIWERFPGICCHCKLAPCGCKIKSDGAGEALPRPQTLRGFQEMFALIYTNHTLESAALHLAEEIGEVDEAVEFYGGTHSPERLETIAKELVDVLTLMCAVATHMDLDLETEFVELFKNGCQRCRGTPCNCGFTASKMI